MEKYLDINQIRNLYGEANYLGATKKRRIIYFFEHMVYFKRTKDSYPKYEKRYLIETKYGLKLKYAKNKKPVLAYENIQKAYKEFVIEKTLLTGE